MLHLLPHSLWLRISLGQDSHERPEPQDFDTIFDKRIQRHRERMENMSPLPFESSIDQMTMCVRCVAVRCVAVRYVAVRCSALRAVHGVRACVHACMCICASVHESCVVCSVLNALCVLLLYARARVCACPCVSGYVSSTCVLCVRLHAYFTCACVHVDMQACVCLLLPWQTDDR